ncbi:MAG: fibrobacter succinogenes major paralogous domain-containing protein [Bacteroidetes bacterium]|nr:fibrobacter succinogenes major paralogous domain-containing protein [Bacteroidota bacterium]
MKKIDLIIFLIGLAVHINLTNAQNRPLKKTETVTDIDGNTYKTIKIGTQVWMAENLKVTKYRNGEAIPNVLGIANDSLVSGAWCYFENDSLFNIAYGKLYNWYAVNDSRGISPVGWHIPSNDEWTVLVNYLGGYNIAGGKMRESDTIHWPVPKITRWTPPEINANNESGFTALPGGFSRDGSFYNYNNGYWWSATEYNRGIAWLYYLDYFYITQVYSKEFYKSDGIPIRCVKD